MYSEDTCARDLRNGSLTLDDALALFEGDEVYVYEGYVPNPSTATWDDVERAHSGSSDLFSALAAAGATEEQMDQVGANIARQRAAGKTLQSLWPSS